MVYVCVWDVMYVVFFIVRPSAVGARVWKV